MDLLGGKIWFANLIKYILHASASLDKHKKLALVDTGKINFFPRNKTLEKNSSYTLK